MHKGSKMMVETGIKEELLPSSPSEFHHFAYFSRHGRTGGFCHCDGSTEGPRSQPGNPVMRQ